MQSQLLNAAKHATRELSDEQLAQYFKNTYVIVSAPRSGSNLLFEQLIKQQTWSIGNESHVIFSQFPHLKFENANMDSGALLPSHADHETKRLIQSAFYLLLKNNKQQSFLAPDLIDKPNHPIFIEKTPRNALNIKFLKTIFPDAKFIYLFREPKQNIASLIEAWHVGLQTGRFATYVNLPDWHLPTWCFLLPRGWQNMIGKELADIACFQWCQSNQTIMSELNQIDSDKSFVLEYQSIIDHPELTLKQLFQFLKLEKIKTESTLHLSKTSLTAPNPDKWRKHESSIIALQNQWQPIFDQCLAFKSSN